MTPNAPHIWLQLGRVCFRLSPAPTTPASAGTDPAAPPRGPGAPWGWERDPGWEVWLQTQLPAQEHEPRDSPGKAHLPCPIQGLLKDPSKTPQMFGNQSFSLDKWSGTELLFCCQEEALPASFQEFCFRFWMRTGRVERKKSPDMSKLGNKIPGSF